MTQVVYPVDIFWEGAKGKNAFDIFTFSVLTIDPPVSNFVVAGPLGSGPTGSLYPYGAAASQVSVVSTSPNDNSTGSGARSVFILGTSDPGGNLQTELLLLNGTTPVISTQTFGTINPFSQVFQVDSTGVNGFPEGDISFSLSGTLVHKIRTGFNRDITAGGNIFSNTTAFFFNQTYITNKQAEIIFQIRDNNIPGAGFVNFDHVIIEKGESHFTTFDKAPVRVPPGASVQSVVKVRFPNTKVIISARSANVPNEIL